MRLNGVPLDNSSPLWLIGGPCVIEGEASTLKLAERLKQISERLGIPVLFKASFDKANRSSIRSFRGIGLEAGMRTLERVRSELELPVVTDVHESTPISVVAGVVDVLQTPAMLCRQTDFIVNVASQGLPVLLKKGQFLSPEEMLNVVEKARSTGNERLMVCERGTTFGYHDLVVDMRGLEVLKDSGCPVIFDAGHSVQRPGARGAVSDGDRRFLPVLARAAVATGIAGIFIETHPDPERALSDGPNSWPLADLADLLDELMAIDAAVKPAVVNSGVVAESERGIVA
jgi:2-dehydro-3-deoxyphosphooctonate aldolase (KDO 8-P synthase)